MAIEEVMLVDMFKSQAKMEVKLDMLLQNAKMEEMEDMMEEACKESESKGEHQSMDGGLDDLGYDGMLGDFQVDFSTLGLA